MLFLQFLAKGDRYVIDTKEVIEIVPFVKLKKILNAPPYVTGLLNYRGISIPVIDTVFLMTGKKCTLKLSTRIVLINHVIRTGDKVFLGLLLEHLTETVLWEKNDFSSLGIKSDDKPYLSGIATDDDGIVQKVALEKILPEEACTILYEN